MSRSDTTPAPEELPFRVELRREGDSGETERVLARAANAQLAQAIFKAALSEYPGRRITLSRSDETISDSGG
jgi:hypothetical protein